ncbi:MAG: anhydro-N-acetylmuramic acid kinase [Pseudorhodobacter sp.]
MQKAEAIWALGTEPTRLEQGPRAAMLRSDGQRIHEFGPVDHQTYSSAQRRLIRAASGDAASFDAAAEAVETAHAALLSRFGLADLIGFAGQELAGTDTLIGSGTVLAEVLGLPVVWDFAAADQGLGGNGFPLTPFFHFACTQWLGLDRPVAWLDLGKLARITWIDPHAHDPADNGVCLAFEAGPGPGMLNEPQKAGKETNALVDEAILASFLKHPFFFRKPPKLMEDSGFSDFAERLSGISRADARATALAAIGQSVALATAHFPTPVARIIACGAWRRDSRLLAMIAAATGCPVQPVEELGLDGDAMEAQAFAHLAVRVMQGLPTSCPGTTGVRAAIGGGVISRPGAS